MKWLVLAGLLLGGCGGTSAALRRQVQELTAQAHPSFDSPADAVMLSPTADAGPFDSDPTHDGSTCPPR